MACQRNFDKAAKTAGANSGIPTGAGKKAVVAGELKKQGPQKEGDAKKGQTGQKKADPRAKKRARKAQNVKTFYNALKQKRKVSVYYRPVGSNGRLARKYRDMVPLDVKGGSSPQTKSNRYMWGMFEKSNRPVCMRLDRVVKVEKSEQSFEPEAVAKNWKGKRVIWNLPRPAKAGWGGKTKSRRVKEKRDAKADPLKSDKKQRSQEKGELSKVGR
jgi:hypothetical protein